MREAVIVDAVRSPMGRGKPGTGVLSDVHPVDLLAHVLRASVERTGVDPLLIDDVICGCVMQTGEQSVNIGRNAVLAAGFPVEVPATTVDRQCGSSQQAIHFAAQGVIAGAYDIAVACGVESMSRVPMGSTVMQGPGFPFPESVLSKYPIVQQGQSAEMVNEKWGVTRDEIDRVALRSQTLAAEARDAGRFTKETAPITVGDTEVDTDQGIRETTLEGLSNLKPAFDPQHGKVTAGNSSQITDGAAAVMIMSREKCDELRLTPRARFISFSLAGSDPVIMLTAPIPATQRALKRANLDIADIDVVEINEAFASVLVAWQREMGLGFDEISSLSNRKINPNGGAIALGHPLGASGARLMTTLLHELERTSGRYGLQTMCEGGGLANGTIIERLG